MHAARDSRRGWAPILLLLAFLYSGAVVAAEASRLPANSSPSFSPSSASASPLDTPSSTPDPCTAAWSVVSGPDVGRTYSALVGVAAISANDVWAVGTENNLGEPTNTLIEHWNGGAWSVVSSPNVGTDNNVLSAVAAVAPNDVWAVGHYNNGTIDQTLVEHWDGNAWTVVPSPNLGIYSNIFYAVAAISANDVWAVGYGGGGGGTVNQSLTEHWDGTSWSIVPSPNVDTLQNQFMGVAAVSSRDVWAVGDYYNTTLGRHRTLVEHWDGSQWSVIASPNTGPDHTFLSAVSALSASDVWAVGRSLPEGFTTQSTLVEHWDGSVWSIVPSPNVGGNLNELSSVTAINPDDVWAVGIDYPTGGTYRTLSEHWDGAAWSIVSSPDVGASHNYLNGVVALRSAIPDNVWSVGRYSTADGGHTLAEHYAPPCTTPGPTSTSVPTSTSIPTSTPGSGTATPAATSTMPPASPTSQASPTPTAIPCSISFSDVQPADYFYQAVRYLYCAGAISGYTDGTFRPYNNTTRGQLSKIVVLAEGWQLQNPQNPTFTDVQPGSAFFEFVETAHSQGVIAGYSDGTFRPNNSVTRGQLTKIVVLAQGWAVSPPQQPTFRDVPASDAFYGYIETAYAHQVISGYSCGAGCLEFRPGNSATRGQISKIVYQALTGP